MAGIENLQPVKSKEEARERGRAGGIASGKARREKRAMKEALEILLSMPLDNKKQSELEDIKSFKDLGGKNITVQDAILIAQIQKALKGDKGAAEYVRDTAGQKPAESLSVAGQINNPFEGLTTEELKKMIEDD